MDTTVLTESVWLSSLFRGYGHDCLSRVRFSSLSLQKWWFKDTTVLTESASALLSLPKWWFKDTTVLTESTSALFYLQRLWFKDTTVLTESASALLSLFKSGGLRTQLS